MYSVQRLEIQVVLPSSLKSRADSQLPTSLLVPCRLGHLIAVALRIGSFIACWQESSTGQIRHIALLRFLPPTAPILTISPSHTHYFGLLAIIPSRW